MNLQVWIRLKGLVISAAETMQVDDYPHLTSQEVDKLRVVFQRHAGAQDVLNEEQFMACLQDMCTRRRIMPHDEPVDMQEASSEEEDEDEVIPSWPTIKTLAPLLFKRLLGGDEGSARASWSAFVLFCSRVLKGNESERVEVAWQVMHGGKKDYLTKKDISQFLMFLVSSAAQYRLIGLNETSIEQFTESSDYLMLAVDQGEPREELIQLARSFKQRLVELRLQTILQKRFPQGDEHMTREEFEIWTRDGDGASAILWLGSLHKMEPVMFTEPTDALHERFACRGCSQCPIRGTRYTCKTCKHWHMCSMCVREGREPISSQGHTKEHEFTEYPKALVIHWGLGCNGCNMAPIVGTRFHCKVCEDFDFCEPCKDKELEIEGHTKSHAYQMFTKASL